jgi:HEAT repeat protein
MDPEIGDIDLFSQYKLVGGGRIDMSQTDDRKQQDEIQRLIKDFSNQDRKVRERARRDLLVIGEPALLPLAQSLSTDDRWARWEIAKTLAQMRNPQAAPILVKELENNDPDVRWLAAEGLIALGANGLTPLLQALINNPSSFLLYQGAHHVLHDLYKEEVHEGELEYANFSVLSSGLKEAVHRILNAMEDSGYLILMPQAARRALDSLEIERRTRLDSRP